MPKIKLNTARKAWFDVPIPNDSDGFDTFKVCFRIPTAADGDDLKIVDLVCDVEDLEIEDQDGRLLSKESTIEWIKDDKGIKPFVENAYLVGNALKLTKQRTLLEQPSS